jgi:23S rRNA (cytosine1962-C5)-methyltransferase
VQINSEWKDYEVIATGDGEKLERWGDIKLLRPDPQVIWPSQYPLSTEKGLHAHYIRESTGGGYWEKLLPFSDEWTISWRNLKFKIKPMGFKHTGLFPEQAVNWARMIQLINDAKRPLRVLNLFAYTGGATVACASAGASVTHVDSSKGMVERAKENLKISGLESAPVRFIIDDCQKFVEREIRRKNFYDAIIMDPPSYGRGPNGEVWKNENNLFKFVELCFNVLNEAPLFVLINSYTTGLQPQVIKNILQIITERRFKNFKVTYLSDEIGLPTKEGIVLPCGASGIVIFNSNS